MLFPSFNRWVASSMSDLIFGRAMVIKFALFCSSQMRITPLTVCVCKWLDIDASLSRDFKKGMSAN